MNKPEVRVYSTNEIWADVEYDRDKFKKDQVFVTTEDHLAMLDYTKKIINGGSFNENTHMG